MAHFRTKGMLIDDKWIFVLSLFRALKSAKMSFLKDVVWRVVSLYRPFINLTSTRLLSDKGYYRASFL